MKNAVMVIAVLTLVAGGLWYAKNSGYMKPAARQTEEMAEPASVTPATVSAGTASAAVDSNVKEIVVNALEFKYEPSALVMKKGETVKLVLNNVGQMPHNFVIDELGVRTKKIAGGDTDTIEFTPEKTGVFEYYCSIGNHRAKGMVGKVTVVE